MIFTFAEILSKQVNRSLNDYLTTSAYNIEFNTIFDQITDPPKKIDADLSTSIAIYMASLLNKDVYKEQLAQKVISSEEIAKKIVIGLDHHFGEYSITGKGYINIKFSKFGILTCLNHNLLDKIKLFEPDGFKFGNREFEKKILSKIDAECLAEFRMLNKDHQTTKDNLFLMLLGIVRLREIDIRPLYFNIFCSDNLPWYFKKCLSDQRAIIKALKINIDSFSNCELGEGEFEALSNIEGLDRLILRISSFRSVWLEASRKNSIDALVEYLYQLTGDFYYFYNRATSRAFLEGLRKDRTVSMPIIVLVLSSIKIYEIILKSSENCCANINFDLLDI